VRSVFLPFLAWAGALQSVAPTSSAFDSGARLLGAAGVLGTLTVLVYRLGVWRQEMEHAKHNVGAQLELHRAESAASFERLERRLDAIDHVVSLSSEQRAADARWRSRTERRLEQLERST
jgi:hypothetical protein